MKTVGVEINSSVIKAGLVDQGKVVRRAETETPYDRPQQEAMNSVYEVIDEVFDPEVAGIGMGVPGLVDQIDNVVIDVVNIPSWDFLPLSELVADYFNKPVYVNNDANCFALGEKYYGKGKPYTNFVGLTIDAGLNAGIIINNRLYPGSLCGAGRFGNIYYRDMNLETYASGQFFRNKNLDGQLIYKRASLGDPVALRLYDELGLHVGRAIASILFALAPQAIIMGGKVSEAYKFFSDTMNNFLEDNFPYRRILNQLNIEVSDNTDMGILGASALIQEEKDN